jgi:hypothetical protein
LFTINPILSDIGLDFPVFNIQSRDTATSNNLNIAIFKIKSFFNLKNVKIKTWGIMLRWIFRKWVVGAWTGSSWLKPGTVGGNL